MCRNPYLELERLNRRPKTLSAFHRWLAEAFDAVRRWREHPEGVDQDDIEFCSAVVVRANETATRLGAGHLCSPARRYLHSGAMDELGRLLAWVDGQRPVGAWTTHEIAKWEKVSPDKVLTWIRNGELTAYNVAESHASKPKYRIAAAEFDLFRLRRAAVTSAPLGRRRRRRAV